jgi:TetR/AcrR family transcriptional repressor of nem operon
MTRISNKDRILADGLKVVLERGYVGASVRDIVEAAGVPQGSFSNHFVSKEAFSLEILDRYFANSRLVINETLRITAIRTHEVKNGCLVGNFAAEASDHSEIIRKRVSQIYAEVREAMAYCLKAAVKAGELPKNLKINDVADFIVTGLQGAWLVSKVERDLAFAENFKKILFSKVLA